MSIKRNSFYGLMGFAVPTMVMLVAYPVLVHHLGSERFGIYFLATAVSNILALLDLGLSHSTLKFVAEDMASADRKAAAETVVTSLVFFGGFGTVGALLIWTFSPWLPTLFSMGTALQADAVSVFRLMAIQFAAFFLNAVLISLFKGMQRFDLSTWATAALSVLTYGGATMGVVLAGLGLVGVTAVSVAANLIVLLVSAAMALSLCRSHGIALGSGRPSLFALRRMLGFGVAMTVHAIGSMGLFYAQRLLVGVLIGPAAVTVYVLAITAVSKVHAMINAVVEVMFPLSSALADRGRLRRVYLRMLLTSVAVATLLLFPLAYFAKPILTVWVGADLASQVAPVLQILAVAYFFVSLSPAPFHVVNGVGRPWFNVAFDMANLALLALLLAIFARDGITLAGFAWAFTIASIVKGLAFQSLVEILIWRRSLLPSTALAMKSTE